MMKERMIKLKIELNKEELKLIKEALMNNSIKYASEATNDENILTMGDEWTKNTMDKSDKMLEIIQKLKE